MEEIIINVNEKRGIVVDQLIVTQGKFILGPISYNMQPGQIHCLLGANGAGKSTLIRATMGVQQRQSGQVHVDNLPVKGRQEKVLQKIGFVPDDPKQLLEELTATEFWAINTRLHLNKQHQNSALEKASQLANKFKFVVPDTTISSFSLGMRKKTQIIAALIYEPSVLILDEPKSGLDPFGIKCMELVLQEKAQTGTTVLVASHDLYWAERFANKIYILDQGILVESGSPQEIATKNQESLAETYFRITGAT